MRNPVPWLPFVVYPSNPATGRLKPAIVEVPAEAVLLDSANWHNSTHWPIDVVFTELADRAIAWYRRAADTKTKRTAATVDELRQWIASTYAIADRVPFESELADRMRAAAAHLTRILDSPQLCFTRWPSLGTTADADKRVSVHLWAIDQLVRHVNDVEAADGHERGGAYVTIPKTALWPSLFAGEDPLPPFADYTEAMKRVRRLEDTMHEHMRDALMVSILADVITHGRRGPDGQPRGRG